MEKIDFSSEEFAGFADGEDVLVDTGILLAYLNSYDSWNNVVTELFDKHILAEDLDKTLFLYINPCVLNEVMHLTNNNQCIISYLKKHRGEIITDEEIALVEQKTVGALKILIENDILIPLEAGKETYLRQMNTYKELGSADSFNASLANDYGIGFLTVDNRLVQNIENNISNFPTLGNVYYAPPDKQSY
jgi:predicted nucleic acid-binding protein